MWKKMKLNNKLGFSLVEAMVGMGLMTAVGVGVMQMQSQQVKSQKNIDADYEIRVLSSAIYNNLKDKGACEETLGGIAVDASVDFFGQIKGPTGTILFNSTRGNGGVPFKYKGQNTIEIVEYAVEPQGSFIDNGDGTKSGSVRFAIFYKKISDLQKNDSLYKKYLSLPLRINVLMTTEEFVSCINATDDIIATTVEKFCESISGVYDDVSEKCNLTNRDYTQPLPAGLSHEGLSANEFANGIWPNVINPTFVKEKMEAMMTGNLVSTTRIVLEQDPTEDMHAIPRAYANNKLRCANGMVGLMTESGIQCTDLLCNDSMGAAQQYLVGINTDGTKICNTLFSDNGSCGDQKGSLKVQANGSVKFECCTPTCSNQASHCSGSQYPSDNGCGLCSGTKPASSATWSAWSDTGETRDISACTAGYIQTEKKQTRTCNGTPECGGANCSGSNEQWVSAGSRNCSTPNNCSSFDQHPDETNGCVNNIVGDGNWQPVSATCECQGVSGQYYASCNYPSGTRSGRECREIVLPPVNGGWSSWSAWSTCSGGTQQRTRSCTNPAPQNGGATCSGSSTESRSCLCVKPMNKDPSDVCAGHCVQEMDSCGNPYVIVGTAPYGHACIAHHEGPGVGCTTPSTPTNVRCVKTSSRVEFGYCNGPRDNYNIIDSNGSVSGTCYYDYDEIEIGEGAGCRFKMNSNPFENCPQLSGCPGNGGMPIP